MFSRSSPCQMGEVWSWFPTTTSNDFFGFSLWCRKNPISGVRTGKHTMFGPDSFEQMGVSQNVVSHINPQFIGPIEMEQKWWCLLPLDLGKKHVTPCSDKAFSLGKKKTSVTKLASSPSRQVAVRRYDQFPDDDMGERIPSWSVQTTELSAGHGRSGRSTLLEYNQKKSLTSGIYVYIYIQ